MEDFARELKSGACMYLLYGDEGVGKTRLLDELVLSRLQDVKVRWIDLGAGGISGDGGLVDSSVLVEEIFARARQGDVIIADHFEMALKRTRHQLFLSWSTYGVDKQLNLIIVSNSSNFNELRQLAQHYQVSVQSFQQMPFNANEAATFLGFYLFPDRPIGKLSIPPLLRDQFSQVQGSVGKIVEIAERAGDQITSASVNDTESMRVGSRVIVAVLIAVAIIIGGAWYFLSQSTPTDEVSVAEVEPSVVNQVLRQPAPQDELEESNPLPAAVIPAAVEQQADQVADAAADDSDLPPAVPVTDEQDGVAAELVQADASAVAAGSEDMLPAEAASAAVEELAITSEPLPAASQVQEGTVNDDAVALDSVQSESTLSPATQVEMAQSEQSETSRLQRDLQASLEWINNRDSSVGTLQVMLLSQKRFDERAYYDYVERLISQGIDVSKLRIFETYTVNQKVYSVVYGEFPSRGAASAAKVELPKILQEVAPIPRSVGGLMTEIQRLEGKN